MSALPGLQWVRLRTPGHTIRLSEDGSLVIEWYDFGESAPYESATVMRVDAGETQKLAELLGVTNGQGVAILAELANRCTSYWEVQATLEREGIRSTRVVDFLP